MNYYWFLTFATGNLYFLDKDKLICSFLEVVALEAESLEENCIQEALLYSVEKVHGALNGDEATEVIK